MENTLARLIVDTRFCTTVHGLKGAGDVRLDTLSPRESFRVTRESIDKRRTGGMDLDFVPTMEEGLFVYVFSCFCFCFWSGFVPLQLLFWFLFYFYFYFICIFISV